MRLNDGVKKGIMTGYHTKSEICFTVNGQSDNECNKITRNDASVKSKCSTEKSNGSDCGDELLYIQNDADRGDDEHSAKVNNGDIKIKTDGSDKINIESKNSRSKLDESSISLDSNVKAFKSSVRELLEDFFRSVSDFESYKQRYIEIVQKHQENSLAEMEQFVKELLCHIMLGSELTDLSTEQSRKEKLLSSGSSKFSKTNESINLENYLLDNISVQHDINNSSILYEEISNIWRKNSLHTTADFNNMGLHCRSTVHEMNVLSDINIVTSKGLDSGTGKRAISLDNIKKIGPVKSQDTIEIDSADIFIPIKTSHAKKDIRMDNECVYQESSENTKSFLAKVCGYICRIFRKDSDTKNLQ